MSAGRRRFRIIKEIAEGGFGKVFLAEQISSDGFSRIVAVKLLHAKWSSHDEVVQRTRDEARLLGLIRHQHIVKVEDLTSIDSKCAIVMEYLEGVDLKWMAQFLKDRNEVFPRAALFEVILAVASALDAAYNSAPLQGGEALKVIHRDIKPSNIFVTIAGGVKVLDFGTARANFAEREAKTQALAFGSQGYMAPERMLGEEDTPAADMFSLGITLYELLTLESFGRIPPRPNKFQKKIEERVAAVKLEGEPEWSDQVRDTLRLMLSYDPKERPTSAQLIEIMELLAQEAKDLGLRRFCRTTVAEAKAALPEPEVVDPLSDTIVDEDASAGTGPQVRTTLYPGDEDAPPPAAPPGVPPGPGPMFGTPAPIAQSRPTPTAEVSRSTSMPVMPSPVVPALHQTPPATSAEGGGMGYAMMAGGGLSVVFLVLGAILGVAALLGILYWYFATVDIEGTPTPPDPTEKPVPPPPPPPEPPAAGPRCGVTKPDGGSEPKKAKTTLSYKGSETADIRIKGPNGFDAEWDGRAPCDLGALAAGQYRANVTLGKETFRLRMFTIDPQKSKCAFEFVNGEWVGGCK